MDFAIILAVTIVGCFALRNPLKALPVAFYAAAIAIDVVYVYGVFFGLPRAIWSPLFVLIQKCELSLALFVVVMFIGCLNRGGRAYHWLKPVRSELSIVAWFLSLGHMAVYLESYLPRLLGGGEIGGNVMGAFVLAVVLLSELSIVAWFLSLGHMAVYLESYLPRLLGGGEIGGNVMGAFVLAVVLLVLLVVLGVTSFAFVKRQMSTASWKKVQKLAYPFFGLVYVHLLLMLLPFAFVKRQMSTASWKKVQKLAYPFFGLVYVHLLLMLLPSALHGGLAAQASVAVYSVVFVGYALCRVGRALVDRSAEDAVSASNDPTPAISDEPEMVS